MGPLKGARLISMSKEGSKAIRIRNSNGASFFDVTYYYILYMLFQVQYVLSNLSVPDNRSVGHLPIQFVIFFVSSIFFFCSKSVAIVFERT